MKFHVIHKYFTLLLIYITRAHNNSIFKLIENVRNTRSNLIDLMCPVFRTTLYKNSIVSYGNNLFNSLPHDKKVLLNTTKIQNYKKEIKLYLLSQQ